MENIKVIHLAETRELLAEWNEVRVGILAGRVTGFHAGVRTPAGATIYLAGVYSEDPMQAVRDLLKVVAGCAKKVVAQLPPFRSSRM